MVCMYFQYLIFRSVFGKVYKYDSWDIILGDIYAERADEGTEQNFKAVSVYYFDSYGKQKDSSMYDIGLVKLN